MSEKFKFNLDAITLENLEKERREKIHYDLVKQQEIIKCKENSNKKIKIEKNDLKNN